MPFVPSAPVPPINPTVPQVFSGKRLGCELAPLSTHFAVIEGALALAKLASKVDSSDRYLRLMDMAETALAEIFSARTNITTLQIPQVPDADSAAT